MRLHPLADVPILAPILVNGRYRVHRVTGVQRYAREIVSRLGERVEVCEPESAKGAIGHLWEQTILRYRTSGRLLWNPCGTGPLTYGQQVTTFHDLFPLEHPEWYSSGYARWYSVTMRALATHAKHLIAVSEYTKSRLVKLLDRDPESVTVVYNGVSAGWARASERQIEAARSELKVPSRRYVLSLSSQESRKNLRGVLDAWAYVSKRVPEDIWLVLAGPRADENVYGQQQRFSELPRVLYTGYVPEEHLCGLYSGASLFVFPSLAEGFGLPLLEAMACGVRCITSENSSLPEVGGDTVDYIDPLSPRELGDQMLLRLTEKADYRQPYEPAMRRAKQFCWDTAASQTRDVLDGVLATSQGQSRRRPVYPTGAVVPPIGTLRADHLAVMQSSEKLMDS